jgi:hypothetical protein
VNDRYNGINVILLMDAQFHLIWQDLHSLTYVYTCSVLMSYLPFTSYLKSHKCKFPKETLLTSLHLREMARSVQPHVLAYMFCPYVISTLYPLLEASVTNVNFQKILFSCTLLTTLYLREMN